MPTILHASDLHFGRPHDPVPAAALLRLVAEVDPEVVVLSGDFTQRAKVHEYQEASRWIGQLAPRPVVVTPGNHDVPLYRVFERLFAPFRNYRAHISEELDSVQRLPGMTVVSLNSAAPHRAIVNGQIRPHQLEFARGAFAEAPSGDLRAVVLHHHLVSAPDNVRDHPLPGARRILDALAQSGVELVMGGHLHRGYIAHSFDLHPAPRAGAGILIVHSGTTSSTRGRGREEGRNSCNLIRVGPSEIEVDQLLFHPEDRVFRPRSAHRFPRSPLRWLEKREGSSG